MSKLNVFRALPRPLGQYLALFLIWPIWLILGVIEARWPGTGSVVQTSITNGLQGIPEAGWLAITGIVVANHVSRTMDKKTEGEAAEAWAEIERIRAGQEVGADV